MTYSFTQLKNAINECTGYDLHHHKDEDDELCYILIDPFGDPDGDPFYDLDDITDYICNNEQIDEYLTELNKQEAY